MEWVHFSFVTNTLQESVLPSPRGGNVISMYTTPGPKPWHLVTWGTPGVGWGRYQLVVVCGSRTYVPTMMRPIMYYLPVLPKSRDSEASGSRVSAYIPIETASRHLPSSSDSSSSSDEHEDEFPRRKVQKTRRQWKSSEKITAVRLADSTGVTRASIELQVDERTLYKWLQLRREAEDKAIKHAAENGTGFLPPKLSDVFKSKRKGNSGRKGLPTRVEDAIATRFQQLRVMGMAVTKRRLRQIALAAAGSLQLTDKLRIAFKASREWMQRFMKRYKISKRRVTKVYTKDLESDEARMEIQKKYLARIAYVANEFNVPPELIFHADETGVEMIPSPKSTLNTTGSKSVQILFYGEKRQVTVMLAGSMSGDVLRPFIIFSGIDCNKVQRQVEDQYSIDQVELLLQKSGNDPTLSGLDIADYRPLVIGTGSKGNHWMGAECARSWIEQVLMPAAKSRRLKLGLPDNHPIILSWDVYASHRHTTTLSWLVESYPDVKLVFVPARCTSFLQVVDVAMAAPFKRYLEAMMDQWSHEAVIEPALGLRMSDNAQSMHLDAKFGKIAEESYDEIVTDLLAKTRGLKTMRPLICMWVHAATVPLQMRSVCLAGVRRIGLDVASDNKRNANHLSHAVQLLEMGQLWEQRSKRDVVARNGSIKDIACDSMKSNVETPHESAAEGIVRRNLRVQKRRGGPEGHHKRCSLCRKRGHVRTKCPIALRRACDHDDVSDINEERQKLSDNEEEISSDSAAVLGKDSNTINADNYNNDTDDLEFTEEELQEELACELINTK